MTLVAFLLTLGAAHADGTVTLTFPDSSPRYAWVQDGLPTAEPKDPSKVLTPQIDLVVPPGLADAHVIVWDKDAGTLGTRKLSELKNNTWDVKPADLADLERVQISVEHDGKPVAAANVDLNDADRTQTQLLDSSANGALTFFVVHSGKIEVTVRYRSGGAMATPVTQTFTAETKLGPPPVFKVALPDPVAVVGGPSTTATGAPAATDATGTAAPAPIVPVTKPNSIQSSPVGSFVVVVVVLGAVLFAGYQGAQFLKKNPDKARIALEQLGAQIPKPGDDPLNEGVPNVPIQAPAPPQPIQKIVLDNSAPDPIAPTAAFNPYSAPAAVASSPQLRSASGDVIPIGDAPITVGRDLGLGLSLAAETSVSRRHAEIVRGSAGIVLKDLGSTNGTFVNGSRLQGEVVLRPGDEVRFGAVAFRYEG